MAICIPTNIRGEFTPFITNIVPDLNIFMPDPNQCFPLYIYDDGIKKENILDSALHEYKRYYANKKITKQDIFYYIYGLLHHPAYRKKFANNLVINLPHIPMAPNFKKFNNIGEKLANLHLTFDTCKRYNLGKQKNKFGVVDKMKYKRIEDKIDKTILQINGMDIFHNIPKMNYMVGNRTPLEWIFDRYKMRIDEDSNLTRNPCNDIDIIPILERAIYVGVESDKLIAQLPREFEPKNWTPKKIGLDAHMNTSGQSKIG